MVTDVVAHGISTTGEPAGASLNLNGRTNAGQPLALRAPTLHDRNFSEITPGVGWQRQWDADWQTQPGVVRLLPTPGRLRSNAYSEAYALNAWQGCVSLLVGISADARMDRSNCAYGHLARSQGENIDEAIGNELLHQDERACGADPPEVTNRPIAQPRTTP